MPIELEAEVIRLEFDVRGHAFVVEEAYDEYDILARIVERHAGETGGAWLDEVIERLRSAYGANCSRNGAAQFFNAVMDSISSLKKKNGEPAASRTDMESTPPDGPSGDAAAGSTT